MPIYQNVNSKGRGGLGTVINKTTSRELPQWRLRCSGIVCCVPLRPRDILVGTQSDIQNDCQLLQQCRNWMPATNPWDVFSSIEYARCADYMQKYNECLVRGEPVVPIHDLFLHVGDEPRTGWITWSAKSGRVPTLRRSSGLIVSALCNRHVLLPELYMAHGYACFDFVARAAGVSRYQTDFSPFCNYNDSRKALGNSQHVANVGCIAGAALMCTERK